MTSACGIVEHTLNRENQLTWHNMDITRSFREEQLGQTAKTIWFTGLSGSGKSTLIKLLLKELEPTEGTITLNGIDIWKYNYEEYTRAFSVVFQDFAMFSLPVGENIAASSKVDEERAWEVLEEVELAERVRKMKDLSLIHISEPTRPY